MTKFLAILILWSASALAETNQPSRWSIRVSQSDPRFFELQDGTPFFPIGVDVHSRDTLAPNFFHSLAAHGANFARIHIDQKKSNQLHAITSAALADHIHLEFTSAAPATPEANFDDEVQLVLSLPKTSHAIFPPAIPFPRPLKADEA